MNLTGAGELAIELRERLMESAAATGLSSAEVIRRQAEFGPNTVSEKTPSRWRDLFSKFWAPIPWMFEAAIMLQVGLGQYIEAGVIGGAGRKVAIRISDARAPASGRPAFRCCAKAAC